MKNTLKLATLILGVVLISCGGKSITPTPPNSINKTASFIPPSWIWGVTTDNVVNNTLSQTTALSSFSKRTMIRTVFDQPKNGSPVASDYLASVTSVSAVSDILGLLIDSSDMPNSSLSYVQSRVSSYLSALGSKVAVWEVGNEINGNWLGSGVIPKVEAMYDAVKAAGKPAAITFYYENPITPGYDMLPWIDANIPAGNRMRTGLDYAFVSYYEDQNGGHQLTQTELNTIFSGLHARFPNAKLGFGECGYGGTIPPAGSGDVTRAALLNRFYGYRVPTVPAFIGGNFYWNWNYTSVPKSKPDWTVLNTQFQNNPAPSPTPTVAPTATPTVVPTSTPSASPTGTPWIDGQTYGPWYDQYGGYGVIQTVGANISLTPRYTAGSTEASLITTSAAFGDFTAQTTMTTVSQNRQPNPNAWEAAWFLWHYTDDNHFYSLVLHTDGSGWELGKEDPAYPGSQRFLATPTTPSFPMGSPYTVKVIQSGATMSIYVNGAFLITYVDTERPYYSGKIGLYTEDAHVVFTPLTINNLTLSW